MCFFDTSIVGATVLHEIELACILKSILVLCKYFHYFNNKQQQFHSDY